MTRIDDNNALVSDQDRVAAMNAMQRAMKDGRLSTAELETRVESILAATRVQELNNILVDLPARLPERTVEIIDSSIELLNPNPSVKERLGRTVKAIPGKTKTALGIRAFKSWKLNRNKHKLTMRSKLSGKIRRIYYRTDLEDVLFIGMPIAGVALCVGFFGWFVYERTTGDDGTNQRVEQTTKKRLALASNLIYTTAVENKSATLEEIVVKANTKNPAANIVILTTGKEKETLGPSEILISKYSQQGYQLEAYGHSKLRFEYDTNRWSSMTALSLDDSSLSFNGGYDEDYR